MASLGYCVLLCHKSVFFSIVVCQSRKELADDAIPQSQRTFAGQRLTFPSSSHHPSPEDIYDAPLSILSSVLLLPPSTMCPLTCLFIWLCSTTWGTLWLKIIHSQGKINSHRICLPSSNDWRQKGLPLLSKAGQVLGCLGPDLRLIPFMGVSVSWITPADRTPHKSIITIKSKMGIPDLILWPSFHPRCGSALLQVCSADLHLAGRLERVWRIVYERLWAWHEVWHFCSHSASQTES